MSEHENEGRELDFESDIAIDIDALDFEWIRQASLYQLYSQELANATKERDDKKEELAIRKAELGLEIRDNPDDFIAGKVTNDAIEATIVSQEDIQELNADLNQLNYEVNRLYGIIKAFDHKKAGLEYLSRLYLGGYFADPKIPAAAQDAFDQKVTDQATASLKNSDRMQKRIERRKANG